MEYLLYNSKYLSIYGYKSDIKEHLKYRVYESFMCDNDWKPSYHCKIQYINDRVYYVDGIKKIGVLEPDCIVELVCLILNDGVCYDLYNNLNE